MFGENLYEHDGVYRLERLEFGVGEIESPCLLEFIVLMLRLLCFLSKHGVLEAEWLSFLHEVGGLEFVLPCFRLKLKKFPKLLLLFLSTLGELAPFVFFFLLENIAALVLEVYFLT